MDHGLLGGTRRFDMDNVNVFIKSANKYEEAASKAARKKADPIVLPEGIKGNAALAFRMGYTDIEPVGGRLFKGALSVEPQPNNR